MKRVKYFIIDRLLAVWNLTDFTWLNNLKTTTSRLTGTS